MESPSVDAAPSSLISSSLVTSSHMGKISNVESPITSVVAGNDLSSMQFLDETTRSKLAEACDIWGSAKPDHPVKEQAWENQVLLNNFANINIGNSPADWSNAPHDTLFMSSPSCKGILNIRTPSALSHNISSTMSSAVSTRPYHSNSNNQPENVLFNQLAAQLLIQQQGVSSNTGPMVQSYYPSPSYTDPAVIGLGHLSTASSGNSGNTTLSGQPVKSAYANPYQDSFKFKAASDEYESLNSLLSSSFGHHQDGEFNVTHQPSTYPSSPATRPLNTSRVQSSIGTFAPPPGFGAVASSQSTNLGGANPTIPPPALRSFYNAQIPPPTGLPLQPAQHSSFAAFNSQQSNWMSSTHGKQTSSLQQQMPWWN
ncbi:hypothetical protein DICVIV_12149 [Dictyocaulus viviparus]|uniref:Uncharacterized protein n=1 Tax=Dictyocaulus viviparus TaxID=29172 RepID=A0A0D8XDZ2_DICVI|nr:hypothetical protein DICVIV_12149 [Dictyocaulus viviparus]